MKLKTFLNACRGGFSSVRKLHPTLRRFIFWAHLATGIIAGAVILLLAVTGLLMSFETQIIARAERSIVESKATSATTPLGPEAMVKAFETSGAEGRPGTLILSSAENAPAVFQIGRGSQQLFHPATGESLGKGAEGTRKFFQNVVSLHRWITLSSPRPEGAQQAQGQGARREGPAVEGGGRGEAREAGEPRRDGGDAEEGPRAGGENRERGATQAGEARPQGQQQGGQQQQGGWRQIGGAITAAASLVFFFLLLSGLFLWIPKKMTWKAFKAVLLLQPRLKGRARDWNWHNIAGFWTAPFILLICLTGIIMAYPWANRLMFQSVGELPPQRQGAQGAQGGGEGGAEGRGMQAEGSGERRGGERRARGERPEGAGEAGAASREESSAEGGERPRGNRGMRAEGGGEAGEGQGRRGRGEGAVAGEGRGPREGAMAEGEGRGRGRGEGSPAGEGEARQERGGEARRGGREGQTPTGPIVATDLDKAAETARKEMPGWRTMSLELPNNDRQPLVVTITDAGRGRPDRRVKMSIDRADFSVIKRESLSSQSTGTKMRQFVRWIHTGEAGGWAGQLVGALTCAATIVLVWTGFALAWRRLGNWRKKRRAA